MDKKDILSRVDHMLLKQTITREQIEKLRRESSEYIAASMCIPPCYTKQTEDFTGDEPAICIVVGFSNGNTIIAVKVLETEGAVKNSADEIDMVISIGLVKAGHYDQALNEIRQTKTACGDGYLKVIIETCPPTEEGKKGMCRVVMESEADFIETSTRFSTADAMPEDVAFMRKHSGPGVRVKVAGGITSIEDVQRFIELGADRLGTNRLIL